jgi:hypothetical protein
VGLMQNMALIDHHESARRGLPCVDGLDAGDHHLIVLAEPGVVCLQDTCPQSQPVQMLRGLGGCSGTSPRPGSRRTGDTTRSCASPGTSAGSGLRARPPCCVDAGDFEPGGRSRNGTGPGRVYAWLGPPWPAILSAIFSCSRSSEVRAVPSDRLVPVIEGSSRDSPSTRRKSPGEGRYSRRKADRSGEVSEWVMVAPPQSAVLRLC